VKGKIRHLDLFSGIGGFALAAQRVWGDEHEVVAFCEIEEYAQKVLKKHWPGTEIIKDVRTIKGNKWGTIDLITGGFPCQDLSHAGKQSGISAERSGLWEEYRRIISEVRPTFVVVENVTALLTGDNGRWFSQFLGDLAQIGYDAQWHCIPASYLGANHTRDRSWIMAHPNEMGRKVYKQPFARRSLPRDWLENVARIWQTPISEIIRMDDGVSNKLDKNRIAALGNAIVPQIAELIFMAIKETRADD